MAGGPRAPRTFSNDLYRILRLPPGANYGEGYLGAKRRVFTAIQENDALDKHERREKVKLLQARGQLVKRSKVSMLAKKTRLFGISSASRSLLVFDILSAA